MELTDLYRDMARVRAFEIALEELWEKGLISGEMHLGTGEEGLAAGLAAHLEPEDALALDHRSTPLLTLMGVDPVLMLKEMLGREDGLCGGFGGHMHLFSREHRAASSGIVGAAGPLALGFAMGAEQLRPGSLAVAMFGEGAANQGMLLESLNLASAWSLPVLFVCKDNGWAITSRSAELTGGDLCARARSFGLEVWEADGREVEEVYEAAGKAVARIRRGKGPAFLYVTCPRLDGHFLGDPLIKTARHPIREGRELLGNVMAAAARPGGAGVGSRVAGLTHMTGVLRRARRWKRGHRDDPLSRARRRLSSKSESLAAIEESIENDIEEALKAALDGVAQ